MPSIRAPIATRQWARSVISGSRAALIRTRLAVGQRRGHQQVFGGADRDAGKHDLGAAQPLGGARLDIALAQFDLGAEPPQPLEVQIDRPGADRAAARQRHAARAAARHQRPQHQHRGAHLAHEIVGRGRRGDVARREFERAARPRRRVGRDADRDAVLHQKVAPSSRCRRGRADCRERAAPRSTGSPPSAAMPRSWHRRSLSCPTAAHLRGSGSCPSSRLRAAMTDRVRRRPRLPSVVSLVFMRAAGVAQAAGSSPAGASVGGSASPAGALGSRARDCSLRRRRLSRKAAPNARRARHVRGAGQGRGGERRPSPRWNGSGGPLSISVHSTGGTRSSTHNPALAARITTSGGAARLAKRRGLVYLRGPPARAPGCRSSVVEHPLGKGEVESSILSGSTSFPPVCRRFALAARYE